MKAVQYEIFSLEIRSKNKLCKELLVLFNSFTFLIFLPIVFTLYWFVFQRNLKLQNAFILVVSYVFYGWWDWRFLGLIAFSSLVDYLVGLKLGEENDQKRRNILLGISLGLNLGLLGLFKYFNFFIDSTIQLLNSVGFMANPYSLQLILPVGISFYTFQTMSYTIDIYKRQIEPTKDPIDFFAFVSFFPQLVAGPIERASNLLPQFFAKRNFTYEKGKLGMELILWGLFKKVVIADNCALVVNQIFERVDDASSIELLLGMFLFSFQIYGDFSGYSDIAIGVGSLLGFTLMTNFKTPYFSVDIVDFWRRWHISLSTWFRDYVYIPLGGSKINLNITFRNIFLVFLVSGFWHGANWTFVFWGAIHSILFIFVIWNYQRSSEAKLQKTGFFYKKITPFLSGLLTFVIVTIAWIFFRSTTLQGAFQYLSNIWINFDIPSSLRLAYQVPVFFVLLMMVMEWRGKDKNSVFEVRSLNLKYSLYFVFFLSILFYGAFVDSHQFIYFQF